MSPIGFQTCEEGATAGADVFSHHAFGTVAVLGQNEVEHMMVLSVRLQRTTWLAQ